MGALGPTLGAPGSDEAATRGVDEACAGRLAAAGVRVSVLRTPKVDKGAAWIFNGKMNSVSSVKRSRASG